MSYNTKGSLLNVPNNKKWLEEKEVQFLPTSTKNTFQIIVHISSEQDLGPHRSLCQSKEYTCVLCENYASAKYERNASLI